MPPTKKRDLFTPYWAPSAAYDVGGGCKMSISTWPDLTCSRPWSWSVFMLQTILSGFAGREPL